MIMEHHNEIPSTKTLELVVLGRALSDEGDREVFRIMRLICTIINRGFCNVAG
jgi:hypothetical protein